MQITRNSLDTATGPSDRFTGTVYIDTVAVPEGSSRLMASNVHFTPGARTAWHTHPNGQTIWVLEGVGRCQRRGGPVELIRPGDRVFFEPDEEHWHGAAAEPLHGACRDGRGRRRRHLRHLGRPRQRRRVRGGAGDLRVARGACAERSRPRWRGRSLSRRGPRGARGRTARPSILRRPRPRSVSSIRSGRLRRRRSRERSSRAGGRRPLRRR